MFVTIDKIQKGLTAYIDTEISNQLTGWEKIGFCTASALILRNLPETLEQYRNNKFIQMLGIIDDNGNIDIDSLRDAIAENLKEEHIDIPIIKRRLKVTQADLDSLYNMIKEV